MEELQLSESDKKAWDEVAKSADVWNKKASVNNGRIFREAMWRKGRKFLKDLYRLFEDCEVRGHFIYMPMLEIVSQPIGEYVDESEYREYGKISGYWCDQWSVGMEGDSWSGYIYVRIGHNKYIKAEFHM